jgi:hypothetical protein
VALGVIRVKGNVCKYSSRAPNKAKRGKFTSCKGKRITGGRKKATRKRTARKSSARSHARKSTTKKSKHHCQTKVVSHYGNKRCRHVCWTNGKKVSDTPASGCKWL